jgi:hypothetical protein
MCRLKLRKEEEEELGPGIRPRGRSSEDSLQDISK